MSDPGDKFDDNKARWDLLPAKAVASVVDVLTYGAKKYQPDGWRKVPDARRRYYAAAMRHLAAWWCGSPTDKESGLPHLAHATCCLLFLAELEGQPTEKPADAPPRRHIVDDSRDRYILYDGAGKFWNGAAWDTRAHARVYFTWTAADSESQHPYLRRNGERVALAVACVPAPRDPAE